MLTAVEGIMSTVGTINLSSSGNYSFKIKINEALLVLVNNAFMEYLNEYMLAQSHTHDIEYEKTVKNTRIYMVPQSRVGFTIQESFLLNYIR